jgi:hypothetical protein
VREIYVPLVWRHVRTLGLVAEVAEIALVDDLGEVGLGNPIDFHRRGFVDQVKQGRKRVAKADTASAPVADAEDALQLLVERSLVVELRILPVQRMTRRRFKAALARAG